MKTRLITAILATAALCLAQGKGGPQAAAGTCNLDLTRLQTITGTVTAVNIGFGTQYPSITIGQKAIKVAPPWYLLERNFEIRIGDPLKVKAAQSKTAGDPYLYAIEISNTSSAAYILLRDAAGVPLWTSGRPSGAPPANGGCLAGASVAFASGTIEQINSGPGIQMPTLVLKTADSKLLTIKLGSERLLLSSDLELIPGAFVTVKYAAACDGDLVALAITDAAGTTLVLRDDSGRPLWN